MKQILRRALTGAVYIVLLLSAVFLDSDAFDFLFMTFGLACLYEYKRLVDLKGYHIFIAYLALWWIFIYLIPGQVFMNNQLLVNLLMSITIVIDIVLLFYLFSKKEKKIQHLTEVYYRTFLHRWWMYFSNNDTL